MKDILVQLAKDKGFVSVVIGKSVTAKYSNKPFYILWLYELKKWLKETHNLLIVVDVTEDCKFWKTHIRNIKKGDSRDEHSRFLIPFKTELEALEKGVLQALNMIK